MTELVGLDGVEVAADVPSMAAELHGAAVALVPASSGSGIKNKVLEAFAAGTPVVTNSAGIDGVVGARDGGALPGGRGRRTRWPRRPHGSSPRRRSGSGSPRRPALWSRANTAGTAAPGRSSSCTATGAGPA